MASSAVQRGSALLTVLWLSAALSAIAFSVANTVRAETERTGTQNEALRAYYLASGAIDGALLRIQWGGKYYKSPTPLLRFLFPSGEAVVEVIPENSKLNVNTASSLDLVNLALAAGAPMEQAQLITAAILDWRSGSAGGAFTEFDQHYLSLVPSFRARHASFEEIEELLLVRGMTPDLFYGHFDHNAAGALVPRGGLRDCLSIYGTNMGFDINTVDPTLMSSFGLPPDAIAGIVAARRRNPIVSMEQLAAFGQSGPGFQRLHPAMSSIVTLRSTARLRLPNGQMSDVQRTVAALVKFVGFDYNPPYHILRWYDNAWAASQ